MTFIVFSVLLSIHRLIDSIAWINDERI